MRIGDTAETGAADITGLAAYRLAASGCFSEKFDGFRSQKGPLRHYCIESGFVLICEGWMSPSDEQCVRSCLDGHPEAFRHLVERYQTPLLRHLRLRLGNVGEATEAAQEAFVRAYFALGDLRKPEAFFSWLLGIADRVAKETHRAAKRRRHGRLWTGSSRRSRRTSKMPGRITP